MARKNAPDRPKPWAALGISESTYYRRKRNGTLDITPSLTVIQRAKTVKKTVKAKTVTVKAAKTVKAGSDSPNSIGAEMVDGRKATQFKPGQVANPAGRPKGSRNKVTERYISAMCADFEQYGEVVIHEVRSSKPEVYLRCIADLVPKQVEVGEAGAFDGLSDDELDALLAQRMASLQRHQAERSAYLQ